MPEKKFSNEFCKYEFNEEEKKELAAEMAQAVTDLKQKEDDKKAVVSGLNSEIDTLKAQINGAATKLNNGWEMKTIKCEVFFNIDAKKVCYIRTDNGETVRERDITQDELQTSVF